MIDRRAQAVGIMLLILVCAFASVVQGDAWMASPYRIKVILADEGIISRSTNATIDAARGEFVRRLQGTLKRIMGSGLEPEVQLCPASLARDLASDLPPYESSQWNTEAIAHKDHDKLFIVRGQVQRSSGFLTAWQYTPITRSWELPERLIVSGSEAQETQIAQWLMSIFLPVARMTRIKDDTLTLQLRAGFLLEEGNPGLLAVEGDIYEPYYSRSLGATKLEIEVPNDDRVPWTVLRVQSEFRHQAQVRCDIVSRFKRVLNNRTPGKSARYAVRVRLRYPATRLRLETQGSPPKPLAAYGVWTRAPSSQIGRFLGRTDSHAEISITPGDDPLQVIVIQNGNQVLARLPMLVGARESVQASLPDDDPRMQAEGMIRGIQERIVDDTARRKMLLLRARAYLKKGETDAAEKLWGQIRDGVSRDDFVRELIDRQRSYTSPNKSVQARIDDLFARTRQLIQQQPWDDAEVTRLQQEIAQAKGKK